MATNCYVCGASHATQPLVLKESFTAHTRCKAVDSKNLCSRCYDCLEGRYKQCWYFHPTKQAWSKLWGRNWSWLVCSDVERTKPTFHTAPKEDGLLEVRNLPTRADIKSFILNPPEPPFRICIAESGQKHTYPFSIEAHSKDNFPVQFEDKLIYCDRIVTSNLISQVEILMSWSFNKTEISTGEYSPNKLSKINLVEFLETEKQVSAWRATNLFCLVMYVV